MMYRDEIYNILALYVMQEGKATLNKVAHTLKERHGGSIIHWESVVSQQLLEIINEKSYT